MSDPNVSEAEWARAEQLAEEQDEDIRLHAIALALARSREAGVEAGALAERERMKAGASAPTPPTAFCAAMDDWAARVGTKDEHFAKAWRTVRSYIYKSCLLDRVLYGGEKPSTTPCPVHKGRWSGIHFGWPGQTWTDLTAGAQTPADESPQCREWFDAGCRCFQHSCGCTTGWQPETDEPARPAPPNTPTSSIRERGKGT